MQIVKVVIRGFGKRCSACTADAHLLAPKLRTLSPQDTAAAARRNHGSNALERVRLLGFGKASLNRRVGGHAIPIPDAVA